MDPPSSSPMVSSVTSSSSSSSMASSCLRTAKGMQSELEKLQAGLIRRFTNLVNLAEPKSLDRGSSAVTQFQLGAETGALIRATEDIQTLIRHMQEMWLFGQLNTLGESQIQRETDANAGVVMDLMREVEDRLFGPSAGELGEMNAVDGGRSDGNGAGDGNGNGDEDGDGDGDRDGNGDGNVQEA